MVTDRNTIIEIRALIAGIAAAAAVLVRVGIIKINPHIRHADGEEQFLTPETVKQGIIEAGDAAIGMIMAMDPDKRPL